MAVSLDEMRKASRNAVQKTNEELEAKAQLLTSNEAKDVIDKLLKTSIPLADMRLLQEIVQKTTNKNLALLAIIQKSSSLAKEVKNILFKL